MKTLPYRWRVSSERIAALRTEARREGISLTKLLNRITAQWLRNRRDSRNYNEADQAAIRRGAMAAIGSIRGGDPTLSTRAREVVRERIVRKHAKESNASSRLL